jgi:DNA-binding transcriptional regulator YhcF (GntR family)
VIYPAENHALELHIVIQGRKDLAQQLYDQLREGIESGRLAAGTQLPPSRLLAEQLGLSRKTISDTYARLTYENYLIGKIGSGTFVNTLRTHSTPRQADVELTSRQVLKKWEAIELPLRHPSLAGTLRSDFIGGATHRATFPHEDWRRCTHYALRQMAKERGFYSQPEGVAALRSAIAGHVAFSRGVKCGPNDVVVCNGAQQALDLLARVMVEPGCSVAMEDPGYSPARLLFAAQGAQVIGIPVDEEGIRVDSIPDGVRFIYVTPSHQFPLGMPMSMARREALLEKARSIGAIIIEDDYDGVECGDQSQATDRLAHQFPGAMGAGQIHQRRHLEQAHSSLPRDLCRASRANSGAGCFRPVAVARGDSLYRRISHGAGVQGPGRHEVPDRNGEEGRHRSVFVGRVFRPAARTARVDHGLWRHRNPRHRPRAGPVARSVDADGLNTPT